MTGNPVAVRAIFISYRREDSEGEAGRLFDDLAIQFGKDCVFMDVTGIPVGQDFRVEIDKSVATCGVLLAIIGKSWIDIKNEAGQRRLDDPFDFVRLETAAALKRGIPVIPVLVRGAKMPRATELPDDLKDLAYRNGCELTHARWASDLQLLATALHPYLEDPTPPVGAPVAPAPGPSIHEGERPAMTAAPWWKSPVGIAIVLGVILAACLAAYLLFSRHPAQQLSQPQLTEQPQPPEHLTQEQLWQLATTKKLKDRDLEGFSRCDLDKTRNEIYARHGATFKRHEVQSYFLQQTWYHPGLLSAEDKQLVQTLSHEESHNASFIEGYEEKLPKDPNCFATK